MMHLCFLSINKNYKSHTFFNLTDEVQSQRKWMKTQVLIDSECKLMSTINTKYVQKQHLQTWKLKYNKILRSFNKKITWITHLVIMKLQFNKHVEHVKLYVHDLKNNYDMIFRFQWLKQHNSQIDWIHEIMKFDTQYCWSNCLYELSWYVHNHNYMNMTWYELLLSSSTSSFKNDHDESNSWNQQKLNMKNHEKSLKMTSLNYFLK